MEEILIEDDFICSGFDTLRLHVTPWTATTPTNPLRSILTPAVLASLPPSLQLGNQEPSDWIADRLAESRIFAVNFSNGLAGLLILAQQSAGTPVHVGYLLAEAAWGNGYASELLRGLVGEMANHAPVELLAGVDPSNLASIRVLEKAGFERLATSDVPGVAVYQMNLN